jgi:hypothetical protein
MENHCTFSRGGETISFSTLVSNALSRPDNAKLVAEAITFLQEMYTFVHPLSVDLVLACRDETWAELSHVPSSALLWSLQSSEAPPHVVLDSWLPKPRISKVQRITIEEILEWINDALNQPEYYSDNQFLTWYSIALNAIEVRIPDEEALKNSQYLTLQGEKQSFEMPLIHREDGEWVASPTRSLKQELEENPFSISLYNLYGNLEAEMLINWSTWTHQSQGLKMIKDLIMRMVNRGWTRCFISPTFSE